MVFPGAPADQPASTASPSFNAASKSVTIDVFSDAKATAASKASVSVPKGLGVGDTVTLHIDDLQPVTPAQETPDAAAPAQPDIKMLDYWGSAETVPEGQPKPVDLSAPAGSQAPVRKLPDASYAYWPGRGDQPVRAQARVPGNYKLTTDYCGDATVTVDEGQDFLAPVTLVGLDDSIDVNKPVRIEWKRVPNAQAYLLNAYGGSPTTVVSWTSSAKPDAVGDIELMPLSQEQVKELITDGVLLPPDTTACTIPAGVFKDMNSAMLTVTAFGKDTTQDTGGTTAQVVVRSTATASLLTAPLPAPAPAAADGPR